MARYDDHFQSLVSAWLEESGLSDREVARRSRGAVSYYTVGQMRKGEVPHAEYIIAFARAVNRDPNELLRAAGKTGMGIIFDPRVAAHMTPAFA